MATAAAAGEKPNGETGNPSLERVLYISMNDDDSLFAVGTTFGFHVFETYPLERRFSRDWGSGVGIIEVYKRSNIVALVGIANASRFSPNKLTIWDDRANRVFADVDFHQAINALRLRNNRIVVAVPDNVHVLNFKDLCPLYQISSSVVNPRCLRLSQTSDCPVIACTQFSVSSASSRRGILMIKRDIPSPSVSESAGESSSASEDPTLKKIPAHDGYLMCVALSKDGKLAATASDKGTLVRVWDTESGKQLKEFRRGAESATIWAMCFSNDNSLLAVASSRGTCHLFGIAGVQNVQSRLWSLGGMISYFDSEWSSIQIPVPNERSALSFSSNNQSLFIISCDGTYRKIDLQLGSSTPTATPDPKCGIVNFLQSVKA